MSLEFNDILLYADANGKVKIEVIPIPIDYHINKAHLREQRFRMVSGWLANWFHAWQHTSTIWS